MRLDRRRAAALVQAADLQWQARSQSLALLTRAERAAAAALRDLNDQREAAREQADPSDPSAMLALERWQSWATLELARHAARHATDRDALRKAKAAAARALSRREAALRLQSRVLADAAHARDRREAETLLTAELTKDARPYGQ